MPATNKVGLRNAEESVSVYTRTMHTHTYARAYTLVYDARIHTLVHVHVRVHDARTCTLAHMHVRIHTLLGVLGAGVRGRRRRVRVGGRVGGRVGWVLMSHLMGAAVGSCVLGAALGVGSAVGPSVGSGVGSGAGRPVPVGRSVPVGRLVSVGGSVPVGRLAPVGRSDAGWFRSVSVPQWGRQSVPGSVPGPVPGSAGGRRRVGRLDPGSAGRVRGRQVGSGVGRWDPGPAGWIRGRQVGSGRQAGRLVAGRLVPVGGLAPVGRLAPVGIGSAVGPSCRRLRTLLACRRQTRSVGAQRGGVSLCVHMHASASGTRAGLRRGCIQFVVKVVKSRSDVLEKGRAAAGVCAWPAQRIGGARAPRGNGSL